MRKLALSSRATTFPHPIKEDAITIPRSLFYLSTSSLVISFILLIVSLLDLGYCSLWLTPPVCVLTLIYFSGVLLISRKERTDEEPSYFSTVVLLGYLMTLLWLIAFILTIVVFAAYPHMVDALRQNGLQTVSVGLQRFECLLCITNLGLVGGFTARSHVLSVVNGEPENWRILVEKNTNPAATRDIRVQRSVTMNHNSNIQEPRAAPTPLPEPEWVTASVLEENERESRNILNLEIQISPPPTSEGFYMSDYYEEAEGEEAFSAIQSHFDRVVHSPNPTDVDKFCDGDSLYSREPQSPDSPENWSDEEEVVEEYEVKEDVVKDTAEQIQEHKVEHKSDLEHPR